ncbi:unnamed protein product [Ambrosiozyma monospora]|uniref:Unnamed protein product n=1 Tax=Ambrosiozyma monospora TaxID=43982 RepID=A0ACB5SYX4_AMBMO|nr:unnamed protein product [Ambrosiozyma monospora]
MPISKIMKMQNMLFSKTKDTLFAKLMNKDFTADVSNSLETNGHALNGVAATDADVTQADSSLIEPDFKEGNLFQTLITVDSELQLNPYKVWFAVTILMYVFEDYEEGKEIAAKIKIGDIEADEDVLSIIEAIGQALCQSLGFPDARVSISYLMLLCYWLWDDFEAVDMLLTDASILDQLLAYLVENAHDNVMLQGMIATLIGIVYEFSTKDSPISRQQLHTILDSRLGENLFSLKIQQFMHRSEVTNFEELAFLNPERDDTGLPEVYFDALFITLIKDNRYRIKGSIGHDPNTEPVRKLNYESYEKVKQEYSSLSQEFVSYKTDAEELSTRHVTEIEKLVNDYDELSKKYEKTSYELEELRSINDKLGGDFTKSGEEISRLTGIKRDLESQLSKVKQQLREAKQKISSLESSNKQLKDTLSTTEEAKTTAENGINKMSRELFQITRDQAAKEKKIKSLETESGAAKKKIDNLTSQYKNQLKQKQDKITALEQRIQVLIGDLKNGGEKYEELRQSLIEHTTKLETAEAQNEQYMGKLRKAADFVEKLKAEKQSTSNELEELKKSTAAAIEELKSKLQAATDEKLELSKSNDELKQKMTSVQDELAETFEEYTSLQEETNKEREELKSTVADLTAKLEESEKLNAELKAKVAELETELKEKVDGHSSSIESLQKELLSAKELKDSTLKELETHKSESETEVTELQTSVCSLKSELDGKTTELKN